MADGNGTGRSLVRLRAFLLFRVRRAVEKEVVCARGFCAQKMQLTSKASHVSCEEEKGLHHDRNNDFRS